MKHHRQDVASLSCQATARQLPADCVGDGTYPPNVKPRPQPASGAESTLDRFTRRKFLSSLPTALALPVGLGLLAACSGNTQGSSGGAVLGEEATDDQSTDDQGTSTSPMFEHGVASGDPLQDRVILWTRVSPVQLAGQAISVAWVVGLDELLDEVVASGQQMTSEERDFTVKTDVVGLEAGTTYYYQFVAGDVASPIGRTRTLPVGSVEHFRMAVASCANYPGGYFHAYRHIANRSDLDLVLHLGDYLYEYGNFYFGDGTAMDRVPIPDHELLSLEDYRSRHGQYKRDLDLQAAHRQHPFITIWDDHELANDTHMSGAQNHQPREEGSFDDRRRVAVQAYMEWMPIRTQDAAEMPIIYRSFTCGDLLQITMLDARLHGRDPQVADSCDIPGAMRQDRSILGADQEQWLEGELKRFADADVRWCVLGQQVMLGQLSNLEAGCIADPDQWDGYPASRDRLLRLLGENNIDNVVVLTGDAHSSWAIDLALDPFDGEAYDGETGSGSLAVEVVVPGVSSAGPGGISSSVGVTHPHVKFSELSHQGYVVLDVATDRVQADWHYVENVRVPSSPVSHAASYLVRNGTNHLVQAFSPSPGGDT